MLFGRDATVGAVASALGAPGLVLVTGPAGVGKTAVGIAAVHAARRTPFAGGGLRTLTHVPGFALTRAVGGRLPDHDPVLAAEAVRLRVGSGVLVLDDAQWADPLSLTITVLLAQRCRVLVCLRANTPTARDLAARLEASSSLALVVDALPDDDAAALVRSVSPTADAATVAEIVRRSGGNPLVLTQLSRSGGTSESLRQVVAATLAELPQAARTGIAALGALGRAVPSGLLADGLPTLEAAGLVTLSTDGTTAVAREPAVAEVALALLPSDQREALHARLARALPPGEAAGHFAAAGLVEEAVGAARSAAQSATSDAERARLLCLAVRLSGPEASLDDRISAARAALSAGEVAVAAELISDRDVATGADAALLRAELALAHGDHAAALAELSGADAVDPHRRELVHARALLPTDPEAAFLAAATAADGDTEHAADARATMAAALLGQHRPGWGELLDSAVQLARRHGAWHTECRAALLHADALVEHGCPADAQAIAEQMTARSQAHHALAWELRYRSVVLWATLHAHGDLDAVIDAGTALLSGAAPADATARAAAVLAVAVADSGNPRAGRRILGAPGLAEILTEPRSARAPGNVRRILAWTDAEVALLAGDYGLAEIRAGQLARTRDLAGALGSLTAGFAAVAAEAIDEPPVPPWAAGSSLPAIRALGEIAGAQAWLRAADVWSGVMVRERVRALWAAGIAQLSSDKPAAVELLRQAYREASAAGLLSLQTLIGATMRRAGIAEPAARTGGSVTGRERQILSLVATGLTSRAIASQLGLSVLTVDSHIRSAMTRLGAPTRLAAALRAEELDEQA